MIDMPRTARKASLSNIYHVMMRGVNRQAIFENDGDRLHFMSVLKECKEISGFRLHAFCLMPNHLHFLIEPAGEPLDLVFRRIGVRYAVWYNHKHQRVGHLFQDRFRSENVENDLYYMTVLRYILQNPMKAGLEPHLGTYRWSSYPAYAKGTGSITDTQYATELFGSRESLIDFVRMGNEDIVMDETDPEWPLQDDDAKKIMEQITGCSATEEFRRLDRQLRNEYIRRMYAEKLSIGQIARLAGFSKSTVHEAVRDHPDTDESGEEEVLLLREEDLPVFDSYSEEVW